MIEEYNLSFLELNDIKKTILSIKTREHGLVEGGKSSYNFEIPILEYKNLISIKKIIKNYLSIYRKKYGIYNLTIINSWFNISGPGSKLLPHKHENSILSGAFYVYAEDVSPLIFSGIRKVKPYNGLLTIFPSDLIHYTEKEIGNRITISFNTDYEKSISYSRY